MDRTPEAKHDALRQWRNTKAFNDLCLTLQLAFVVPSEELLAIDYLKLRSAPSSTGYHVPSKVLEQSRLLLRPGTYQEIVEERAAVKLCGYPCCSKQLRTVPNGKKVYFRLNLSKKEISEERESNFCCKDCHKKSLHFERSLDDVAIKYNSHSVDELKQALQTIMGWYKCKLHLVSHPMMTPNTNTNVIPMPRSNHLNAMHPSNGTNHSAKTLKVESVSNAVNVPTNPPTNPPSNAPTNPLEKMVEDLNLKIIEKNVARNLHQNNNRNVTPKKKWKRPTASNRKRSVKSKGTSKETSNGTANKMDVDATESITKSVETLKVTANSTDSKCNDDANRPLTMTEMEQLFRTAKREKERMEVMKQPQSSKWSKDTEEDVEMEEVAESTNGRKVKVSKELSPEELEKMEQEKRRQIQEERKRTEYAAMSANAQLMGQYISWCNDATTDFVTQNETAYLKWKQIAMKHYNELFSAPEMLKERREMLINNVMKYVNGLLAKFEVNPILHTLIGRDIRLLVETFDIKEGIPAFTAKTWCFIAFVFLKLLSHRVTDLKLQMFGKGDRVKKVLGTIGFGQEYVTTFEEIVVFD